MIKDRTQFCIRVILPICALITTFAWICCATRSSAQQHPAPVPPDMLHLSSDQQLEFADYYYTKGEYYRAISEYSRFLFFFPEDSKAEYAMYKIGMSYLQGQRYEDGINAFQLMTHQFPDGPFSSKALLMISECYARSNQPGQALTVLHNLLMQFHDPDIRDEANYRIGWIHLEMASWDKAQSSFSNISPSGRNEYGVQILQQELDKTDHLKLKNPRLAGFLSLLPGLGYVYLERYPDALTAFLVNGALIYAAYSAFDHDNPALGGIISIVEIGFYSGNIFGSVSGAHKHNRNKTSQFIDTLRKNTKINLIGSKQDLGLLLSLQYRF